MTSLLQELDLTPLIECRRQSRLMLLAKGVFGQAHVAIDCLQHPTRKTRHIHNLHFCERFLGLIATNLVS